MQRLQDEDEDLRRIGQTSSPIPSYCQADVAISIPRDESSISVSRTSQPTWKLGRTFATVANVQQISILKVFKSDHLDKHGLYPHFKARWAMMCIIGVCVSCVAWVLKMSVEESTIFFTHHLGLHTTLIAGYPYGRVPQSGPFF